jgi:predicted nucleic acid-binding protein
MKKLQATVSDSDILINLVKIDRLDVLESLFNQIIVPKYILNRELTKIHRPAYTQVYRKTNVQNGTFQLKDREKDKALDLLAKPVIEHYDGYIGPGESECAGYASALGIGIIVSDNTNDFAELEEEFIMLTHVDVLVLLVKFEIMSVEDAKAVYDAVNAMKEEKYRFSATFEQQINIRLKRIRMHGWDQFLGLKN